MVRMFAFIKTWLLGGAPVEPTVVLTDEQLDEYEAHGCPTPFEVYEWDVEFHEKWMKRSLIALLTWRFVATRKRTPRLVKRVAWKVVYANGDRSF